MLNPNDINEMTKKKEKIILQSLKRKQKAEEKKQKRDEESRYKKEEALWKIEEIQRKKEEDTKRREAILEAHKLKKAKEKAEKEGRLFPNPVQAKPIPKIKDSVHNFRKIQKSKKNEKY